MKKFLGTVFAILVACLIAVPAVAMDDQWTRPHNDSGVSEMAINVVKKIPFGEYDYIVAAFDPLTTITGSGCTVESGTTSLNVGNVPSWYFQGGVTLPPYAFKLNEVLTYWVTDSVGDIANGSTDSGTSKYKYSWEMSSSGATAWKMKVYVMNSNDWQELTTTSGGSVYCGPSYGTASLAVSTSTTFYPTNYVGWVNGVTPYIHVLGKR